MQVKQVKQRIPSFQENAWIVRLYPSVTGTGHSIRSFPITRPVMRTREFEIDSALDVVRAEACTPNWNGEGAKQVSILSLRLVKELLRTAPAWVPLPEIGGDPDGAVGMDWFHDKDRLSVSVYDNREVVFAGRINGERIPGESTIFVGELPNLLLQHLMRMFKAEPARIVLL